MAKSVVGESYSFISQVLLDEMDKNDQLIGEVYNKGDVLLQVISGQSKATVESELNQLEENWAEFCQDTLSIKGVIEETIQMWNDFEENRDKLAEWLGELERGHTEAFTAPANLEALKDTLEEKKVMRVRIPTTAMATRMSLNKRFNEQYNRLCTCVIHLGTFFAVLAKQQR